MKHCFYLVIILSFFSCDNTERVLDKQFSHIERIIDQHPDSALILLNSIKLPSNDEYNLNKFFLYRIQAKDNLEQKIFMDNEILNVYNYFKNNGSSQLIYLSAYYCGRVFEENKKYDDAIIYYNIAENMAIKSGDKELQSSVLYSIGRLLIDQFLVEEAKEKLLNANTLFRETKNYTQEIKSYKLLGFYYLLADKSDSALVYCKKALELSIAYNNKKEQAHAILNIGVIHNEKGEYKKAIDDIKEAMMVDSSVCVSGKAFMNLAEAYSGIGRPDSAKYYGYKGLAYANDTIEKDIYAKANAYRTLSEIEADNHSYNTALELHKAYSENLAEIISENENSAVINAQSKYKYEDIQKENTLLFIKHLKTQRILFLSLLFIALLFIVYNWKLLQKNKQLNKANEEILALTDHAKNFDSLNKSYRDKYKDNLVQNFNVLRRAASLEYQVLDSSNKQGKALIKSFNTIAYGRENIDWDILYNVINSVHNNIFDIIREKYKHLDETEFRICCLIYSKFASTEIAIITQLSINTVHMKTTYIRKKLGIEKYGNIIDYFNQEVDI